MAVIINVWQFLLADVMKAAPLLDAPIVDAPTMAAPRNATPEKAAHISKS